MTKERFQLISDNRRIFADPTVTLSTVEMPVLPHIDLGYRYESCVFTQTDSDVLERYQTLAEAIEGHAKWAKKFGVDS